MTITDLLKQRIIAVENAISAQAKKLIGKDRTSIELTFDPSTGLLTKVVEKNGSAVVETTDLNYTGGVLQSVATTMGSTIVTDTLNYTNGKVTGISRGW